MENKTSEKTLWAVSGVLFILFLVIMLLLGEGAIRLRQWIKYDHWSSLEEMYFYDPTLNLRVLVPGKTIGNIAINNSGFRGPELVNPKPLNDLRIAFVGSSSTYCAEVSGNNKTWPDVAVNNLKQKYPSAAIDYINAAVPGYSLDTSLRNFRTRVSPLQPDMVVIYDFSDMSGETKQLAIKQGVYRLTDNQEPNWFVKHFLLWELVDKNLKIRQPQQNAALQTETLKFEINQLGEPVRNALRQLVMEAQQNGRLVALATYATQLRTEQSESAKFAASVSALFYSPFMTPDGLIAVYARYNQIIREVAKETGAILIEGEMNIPGDAEHFNDTVHFKDKGAEVMAARISDGLASDERFIHLLKTKMGEAK